MAKITMENISYHPLDVSGETASISSRSGVPNLGYMYPKGYICTPQRVHRGLE